MKTVIMIICMAQMTFGIHQLLQIYSGQNKKSVIYRFLLPILIYFFKKFHNHSKQYNYHAKVKRTITSKVLEIRLRKKRGGLLKH
ncbi:hypothetical protein CLU79DRAFT_776863 [Phycomyces nitens]|nr:hypothetical protein CLU79DRAFT_776863 [Phycomyces nitens]